ncbi:DMT family transporter [Roseivivax sediminis]|uniref:Permease of the drug/metabolite transporter (DMT) superfamily n=1 Tax=Roseivivax sediminis TaxID=936889 RepID=A0A1I2A898_9RHOB|nr:DMT family transporter [Roseivivax sediminis]SFE40082.1 Permease of the drug/metabolite transporter (DMT) superfamily [Roseivivax sediminis]
MTDNLRGSLFMVAAMLGFAIEDTLFKAATAGVSAGLGTLIFGITGLALYAALVRRSGLPVWTRGYLAPTMLVRSGFEVMGRLFYALALAFAPLSVTSAILQAAPLVVTLGAALVLGEAVGARRWTAMAVGFAGVLLILRPGADGIEVSALFAVLGMIGFACRDLATRASPPEISTSQLGIPGFATVTVAGLVILAFEPGLPSAPDARALALLLATGVTGVTAYSALTRAMRTGEVSVVAPFRYSRLLFALILAYIIFGERPDALMFAGAALIVGSGLYTLWRSGQVGSPALSPAPSHKEPRP